MGLAGMVICVCSKSQPIDRFERTQSIQHTALIAVVGILEILLEVGNVHNIAILEVGIAYGSRKSLGVRVSSAAFSAVND